MNVYRGVVIFALAPRAARNFGHVLVWLGMIGCLAYGTCSTGNATVSPGDGVDAGTLESAIRDNMSLAAGSNSAPVATEFGPPAPLCFASDVKALCCPSACAVKNSPKWETADRVLRSCMAGIGCGDSESKSATVFERCNCGKH